MRKRVEARNALEGYCVNIKHTVNDDKVQDKFGPGEKEEVLSKISEVESWISDNSNADTEEYEAKQKELERIYNPLASKLYQGAAPREEANCGNQYQNGQGNQSGPQVD